MSVLSADMYPGWDREARLQQKAFDAGWELAERLTASESRKVDEMEAKLANQADTLAEDKRYIDRLEAEVAATRSGDHVHEFGTCCVVCGRTFGDLWSVSRDEA